MFPGLWSFSSPLLLLCMLVLLLCLYLMIHIWTGDGEKNSDKPQLSVIQTLNLCACLFQSCLELYYTVFV